MALQHIHRRGSRCSSRCGSANDFLPLDACCRWSEQAFRFWRWSPRGTVPLSRRTGRPAALVIRSQNFLGNPAQLYVVDGIYMGQNPNLDPADVESIEVLKDASAASQYGAQAGNGVIVIRTRRGRGDTRVELHSYYGFQKVPKQVPMMNTTQWAALAHQAYANAGDAVISGAAIPPPISTDWQD